MPILADAESVVRPLTPDAPLINRIRGEFHEMPGMRLSFEQAARLWALDRHTCEAALQRLLDAGFLLRDDRGLYRKAHAGY